MTSTPHDLSVWGMFVAADWVVQAVMVGLVFAALLTWAVFAFNRLVRLRNQVRAGWSDIDVQLMRRHDLVPRLVEAVRAYAGHEKALLEDVTALRAKVQSRVTPARG